MDDVLRPSRIWLNWLTPAALVLALATCASVEPMRWRLPPRYLFQPLEIHREGFIDFAMCLRVRLSRAEARKFVESQFERAARLTRLLGAEDMARTSCRASFWPVAFHEPTMAHHVEYAAPGYIEGTSGAVYQDNHLYFWSNMS